MTRNAYDEYSDDDKQKRAEFSVEGQVTLDALRDKFRRRKGKQTPLKDQPESKPSRYAGMQRDSKLTRNPTYGGPGGHTL